MLMLTQEAGVNRTYNILNLSFRKDLDCLGPSGVMFLVRHFVGYDVIIMNWIISAFAGNGHLYNMKSKELFNLNFAADFAAKKGVNMDFNRRIRYDANSARQHMKDVFSWDKNSLFSPVFTAFQVTFGEVVHVIYDLLKSLFFVFGKVLVNEEDLTHSTTYLQSLLTTRLMQFQQFIAFRTGVIFTTSFLFFISTTLVNYILRQTQDKMLRFTYLLQFHITHNLPYLSLVFTHVIDSLVFVPIMMGIYFFLFEFFSDQLVSLVFAAHHKLCCLNHVLYTYH
jgi:hypothetical protein